MTVAATTFSPRRALLHPMWLGALALLALNDHVLKGSGLLPGVVTGKLSDFVGLLIAPLLFAALLGVRGRLGWIAAHVSVGIVFAGIQLSVAFADLWSAAMGLVGFPWVVTSDPTDLVALPMLAVSFVVYPRAMQRTLRANARRSLEVGAGTIGLLACVATSREPGPQVDPGPWFIDASVYFHNDNDFDTVVRIRRLATVGVIDCALVEEEPGRLLTEPLFGPVESWTVWPDANLALGSFDAQDCDAVMLEADNVAPVVVFWRLAEFRWRAVQGEGIDDSAPGYVSLSYDEDGRGTLDAGAEIMFPVVPPSGRGEGVCAPQPEEDRIVWSDEVPTGVWFLGDVEPGVDGCVGLDLRTGYEQQEGLAGRSWYLCLPRGAFPFEAGQRVEILPEYGATGQVDGVLVRELDVEDNFPTGLELVASRGTAVPSMFGLTATFVPAFDCGLQVDPECGTVGRPGALTFAGDGFETVQAQRGAVATTSRADGMEVELYVAHAEERLLLMPECAEGPDTIGLDIEIVAVQRGVAE